MWLQVINWILLRKHKLRISLTPDKGDKNTGKLMKLLRFVLSQITILYFGGGGGGCTAKVYSLHLIILP